MHDESYTAAIGLFVAHGYEPTTMDQIAERADVARATVFNHFSQKVGFLEEWGARRRARGSEILGQEHSEDLPVGDRLRRYLREMAELAGTGVLVNAADPGWTRSGMGGPSAPRGPEEGAETPVWLATLPEGDATTGGLFAHRRPLPW